MTFPFQVDLVALVKHAGYFSQKLIRVESESPLFMVIRAIMPQSTPTHHMCTDSLCTAGNCPVCRADVAFSIYRAELKTDYEITQILAATFEACWFKVDEKFVVDSAIRKLERLKDSEYAPPYLGSYAFLIRQFTDVDLPSYARNRDFDKHLCGACGRNCASVTICKCGSGCSSCANVNVNAGHCEYCYKEDGLPSASERASNRVDGYIYCELASILDGLKLNLKLKTTSLLETLRESPYRTSRLILETLENPE